MSAWQWLLSALGFALWAGVWFGHPKPTLASASIEHARPGSRPAPSVSAPTIPAAAAPRETETPRVVATESPPGATVAKHLRQRRAKAHRAASFDAGDGRAILETGLRPAVLEGAAPR